MYAANIHSSMEVYNVRLSKTSIAEIEEIAKVAYIPPRTLVRTWIMQRLEAER